MERILHMNSKNSEDNCVDWLVQKKNMRSLITLMITPFKVVARDDRRCLLEILEKVKDEATNNQDIEITIEFSPFFLSNPVTNSFAAKSQKG